MRENPTPKINPAILDFAFKLRLLSYSKALDSSENRKVKPTHYFTWAFGALSNISFGWFFANFIAVYGLRYGTALDVDHGDWALQTYDFLVNFLVLATIFLAQICWFMSIHLRDADFKDSYSKGKLFLVPHALVVVFSVLLSVRLAQLPPVEYPYYLPNPLVFCTVWIILSTFFFLGLTRFWRYLATELYTDIKKKF